MWSDSSSEEEIELLPASPIPSPPRDATTPPVEQSPSKEQSQESGQSDEPVPASHKSTDNDSNKPGEKRRKRTRKLVSKTYVDDSGFMVTEKVYESDSTDASEAEEIPKVTSKPASRSPTKAKPQDKKKKVSPVSNTGKKQMSLTSFFKKK